MAKLAITTVTGELTDRGWGLTNRNIGDITRYIDKNPSSSKMQVVAWFEKNQFQNEKRGRLSNWASEFERDMSKLSKFEEGTAERNAYNKLSENLSVQRNIKDLKSHKASQEIRDRYKNVVTFINRTRWKETLKDKLDKMFEWNVPEELRDKIKNKIDSLSDYFYFQDEHDNIRDIFDDFIGAYKNRGAVEENFKSFLIGIGFTNEEYNDIFKDKFIAQTYSEHVISMALS